MNWMTVKDVAGYLQLSEMMIYKLAQEGRIPAVKIGRIWRFEQGAIDLWLKSNKNKSGDAASEIISDFVIELKNICGPSLSQVILFGSHARGEENEGSDIDVIVVLKTNEDCLKFNSKISDAAYKVTYDSNRSFLLAPVVIEEKEYLMGASPLLLNIRKEGKIAA